MNYLVSARVEKSVEHGDTGSTLPEHLRCSPGTHKANNYLKDVWIAYQAIYLPNISKTLKLNFLV